MFVNLFTIWQKRL